MVESSIISEIRPDIQEAKAATDNQALLEKTDLVKLTTDELRGVTRTVARTGEGKYIDTITGEQLKMV